MQSGYINATGYELTTCGTMDISNEWNTSKLIYQTIGTSGNHITTIEFRDFRFNEMLQTDYTINFQIRLYENGNKIVYHYGPSDLVTLAPNNSEKIIIGLYSTDGNNGLYLSGSPSSPGTSPTPVVLSSWPADGTVYTFE